ncbi:MAG: phosphatase PAP2 family protein [Vicinamibacteria bacterium]|nr:phosphatase PAP2 family protein [Vicinamibacteria bacterium]
MFDTGINVWLQAMGSPTATALLAGVTSLGYLPFHAFLIVTLAFGVRLRPGLAVLGAVLLTGLVTEGAKEIVAFPRPDQVDDRLMRTAASRGAAIVSRGSASGFWSLPAQEAIEKVREQARVRDHGGFGFPSGHVSATTALLVGTAWSLRFRWLYVFTAVWVPLMALSRMYLGRHFLADVLGGFVIAIAVSVVWLRLFGSRHPAGETVASAWGLRGLWFFCLGLFVLMPWCPPISPRYAGALTGLALSYTLIGSTGEPPDGGTDRQRVSRVLLALAVLATTLGLSEGMLAFEGRLESRLGQWVVGAAVIASTFAGGVVLSRRLGLSALR